MNGSDEMTPIQDVMSKEGIDQKIPPGVLVEGHVVEAKLRDSYISLGIVVPGSIAALVWAFTRGIGWVEIWVFAGTFALSTVGIGICTATSSTAASGVAR